MTEPNMPAMTIGNIISQSQENIHYEPIFATIHAKGNFARYKLFAFAVRTAAGPQLHIVKIGPNPNNQRFVKKAVDNYFPAVAPEDFPLCRRRASSCLYSDIQSPWMTSTSSLAAMRAMAWCLSVTAPEEPPMRMARFAIEGMLGFMELPVITSGCKYNQREEEQGRKPGILLRKTRELKSSRCLICYIAKVVRVVVLKTLDPGLYPRTENTFMVGHRAYFSILERKDPKPVERPLG
jgi:hypothetical protein